MHPLRLIAATLLLLACPAGLAAQTLLPCSTLAAAYGIDSALVGDTAAATRWLEAQADATPGGPAARCAALNTKVQHFLAGLRSDYPERDGKLWVDSVTCIADHKAYAQKLSALSAWLLRKEAECDSKEQHRWLQAQWRTAQEAQAKERAQERTRADSLDALLREVNALHQRIGDLTAGHDGDDDARRQRLKNIYYGYLSAYNQYSLTHVDATPLRLRQVTALLKMQRNIADSLLSPHGYDWRIASFMGRLKQRCDTSHPEVSKAYYRNMRHAEVPALFSTTAQYWLFVEQLRDMMGVQHGYLMAVDALERIEQREKTLLNACDEQQQDVATAYRELTATQNLIPAFTTLEGARAFLQSLDHFEALQETYLQVISLRQQIEKTDQSLRRDKELPREVWKGYRLLVEATPLQPHFATASDGQRFVEGLRAMAILQGQVADIAAAQRHIEQGERQMRSLRRASPAIEAAYQLLRQDMAAGSPIATEEDLRQYARSQQRQLRAQRQLWRMAKSNERAEYERMLRGVKDPKKIGLLLEGMAPKDVAKHETTQ